MQTVESERTLNSILDDYGAATGLGPALSSEDGVFCIESDCDHVINFLQHPENQSVFIWMVVGDVPNVNREAFLTRLLESNLFWWTTDGATLSLLPDGESVVLTKKIQLQDLNSGNIHQTIEDYLNFSERFDRWVIEATHDKQLELNAEEIEESGLRV